MSFVGPDACLLVFVYAAVIERIITHKTQVATASLHAASGGPAGRHLRS
jgi:hypothetical protein